MAFETQPSSRREFLGAGRPAKVYRIAAKASSWKRRTIVAVAGLVTIRAVSQ
jgi:hypothetical protein